MEEAISERRKAFAAPHRSNKDRQAYISGSRQASSVIAKAEVWLTTCSSLSPKSNPKSVHSLFRSLAGFSSTPNFPYSSTRELALIFADYLRSHFPISLPKALRSRASSCSSLFSPAEFLAAATNLSGPDKVAYPMLKHLPRSGMDFLHIFNFFWFLHSFFSFGRHHLLFPSIKCKSPLDSPVSFRLISLILCVSKLFERIILSRLLFFLECNSILSPR